MAQRSTRRRRGVIKALRQLSKSAGALSLYGIVLGNIRKGEVRHLCDIQGDLGAHWSLVQWRIFNNGDQIGHYKQDKQKVKMPVSDYLAYDGGVYTNS